MQSISVNRVNYLKGSVHISGSKNACLPILCSSIITRGIVVLKNVANITDINDICDILRYLNCKVKRRGNRLKVDSTKIQYKSLNINKCSKIRGSYYLIPVMLYLFNKCEIALPGGCKIGQRPIDCHLECFQAFGFSTIIENNVLYIKSNQRKKEVLLSLSKKSVGASINAILCGLGCKHSIIENLVIEPEGLDLISFLKKIGFNISFLNNKCIIKSHKQDIKNRITYKIIPDRMEAMTFVILGLLNGRILIKGANPSHMKYPLDLLINAKYNLKITKKGILACKSRGNAFNIKTDIYPLFPTDMQPLFAILLAASRGMCVVDETIFENRMQIYYDLLEGGGQINVIENKAYITGVTEFSPKHFKCKDLRQGATLLLYIFTYGGSIDNIDIIKRGYDGIFYKLKLLGANFSLK